MLNLFLDNLLPVVLVAGAGYLLAGIRRVEPRPVTHVGFYVLAPCLVFRLLVENPLGVGEVYRVGAVALLGTALPALAAVGVGVILRWPRALIAACALCALLPNAANYGLSAVHFAFGDAALAQAGVYFVVMSILTYTAGVLIASLGRAKLGTALKELVKVPAIWAVLLGFLLVQANQTLPVPLERAVYLLADATIPVFLLILGMQFRTMRWKGALIPITVVVGLRLVGGALAGLGAAEVLGLSGPALQATVLESGMPVAVITIVLATEYDLEPDFVTTTVFVSTLLSPLTLTPLMHYLG